MSNSLKNETIKVEIEGKGKNKQEAVANAFRYLSKNVSERIDQKLSSSRLIQAVNQII